MFKVLNVIFYLIYMFFLFYCSSFYKTKNNKRFLNIFLGLMILFFFFKELGLDYEAYKKWFYEIDILKKYKIFQNHIELIPYMIIYFLRKVGLPHQFFFGIMGMIPLLINFYLINNMKINKLQGLFFLFYINFFTGFSDAIRQNVAASLILLSYYYFSNCKKNRGIICIVSAFFFHYSTIFIIGIIFLLKIKWNKKKYIIAMFFIVISSFILKNGIIYLNYLPEDNILFWKFKYYMLRYNNDRYNYLNEIHKFLYNTMNYLQILGIIILNILLLKYRLFFNRFQIIILKSSIISSLISLLLFFIGAKTIGLRINLTFGFGMYLLSATSIVRKKDKNVIMAYYFLYNFIIMLYYSGVHDPKSPFYLGDLI